MEKAGQKLLEKLQLYVQPFVSFFPHLKPLSVPKLTKAERKAERKQKVGIGAIHDASFMQQLNQGSQYGYAIMLAPVSLYDGPTVTHLLDWNSAKIHRKVRSTLAAEASGASRAYDRAMYARAMIHEIECGKTDHWTKMCARVPFCLGTDCKSLYDLCVKVGSMPDERPS